MFGAGYFLPGSRAQEVVYRAVELYADRGSEAFDIITPEAYVTTAALYPFVVDATDPDLPAVAHGAFPDRVGRSATAVINNTSDRPFEEVIEDLNRDGGTWVEYMYINPDTNTDQLKNGHGCTSMTILSLPPDTTFRMCGCRRRWRRPYACMVWRGVIRLMQ